jgi:transposase-like protein
LWGEAEQLRQIPVTLARLAARDTAVIYVGSGHPLLHRHERSSVGKERHADRSHDRSNVRRVALVLDLDEVERRLDAGDSPQAIASDLGVTNRTIRNHLHAAGRPLAKERHQQQQRNRLDDTFWLRDQYVAQVCNPSDVAIVLNVSTAEVVGAIKSFGIERPPVHPELTGPALRRAFADGATVSSITRTAEVDRATVRREMQPARLDDVGWLRRQYATGGRSMQSIADEVGTDRRTVRGALRRHGIDLREGPPAHIDLDPEWLRKRYVDDGLPVAAIAREVGVSTMTVHRAMVRYGIARRSSGKRYREMTES